MKRVISSLLEVYRPYRYAMLGVFGFIALLQALGLIAPYIWGKLVDGLIGGKPIEYICTLLGVTLAAYLSENVLVPYFRERYEIKRVDNPIPRYLSRLALEKTLGFSLGQHLNENSGVKQSVITRGEEALSDLARRVLYNVIPTLLEAVFLVGVLLWFSPPIGLVALAGILLYASFMVFMNMRFEGDYEILEQLWNQNEKQRGEILRNLEHILSNAQEKRAVREYDESHAKAAAYSEDLAIRFNRFAAVRNTIESLVCFAALGTGVFLHLKGGISVGELVILMSWTAQAFGGVSEVGKLHRELAELYASVRNFFDMFSVEPDIRVVPNPIRPDRFQGKIEFRNVVYHYRGQDGLPLPQPALDGVNFTIEGGETVALVGESGAGKSTVVKALLRYGDPEKGQLLIDDHDLRLLDPSHFRERIGRVEQEVSLFDAPLRYNITYDLNGRSPFVTEAELWKIAAMASLDRLLPRLKQGFDTEVGERGVRLSGGEKQRVGIARALIKDPDILIFDEATSSLDAVNERLIRESVKKASKGRTTIIIAHRFSTIRWVDKVIVFDKGQVAGIGTHEELMRVCEPYQRLVEDQLL